MGKSISCEEEDDVFLEHGVDDLVISDEITVDFHNVMLLTRLLVNIFFLQLIFLC